MATAQLHPLHQVWRRLPIGIRRAAYARITHWLAPAPDASRPAAHHGLAVCGEWNRESGLGEGARLMHAALGGMGVPSWLIEAGPVLPGAPAPAPFSLPPPGVPLVLHVNAPMLGGVLRGLPRGALRGRLIIGYWAWELPVVPPDWRLGARLVHEIWAPSHFTARALEALAPGRVRVVPHPVAVSPPHPASLGRHDFSLPEDAFIVLTSFSLASSFERKNPLAAIAAFRAAFGDRSDRILVLKISHAAHWPDDLARLRAAAADSANIVIDTRNLPRADYHALLRCADVVLSLHRSEGFGLVPAEAMLLGRPVVATNWSATAEFLDATCGMPIPYQLVPARDPRGVFEAAGAVWAEADIGAAAAALRALADDTARCLALGSAAAHTARSRLGDAKLREAVQAIGLAVTA